MSLRIVPITFRDACKYVKENHRHHKPPTGHKFSIGLMNEDEIVGVAMIGRPVSRHLDDGFTAEVNRLCTNGTKNACSMLYSASWRAAKAMGYKKLITYILSSEPGTSLRATGWKNCGEAGGGSWSRGVRQRENQHPLETKIKYEIS